MFTCSYTHLHSHDVFSYVGLLNSPQNLLCLRGLQPSSSAKATAPEASKKDASSTKRTSSKHRDKSASKSKDKRAADKTSNDTGDKPAPIRKPRKAAADDTKATAVDAAVKDEATGKDTVAAETVAKPATEEAVPEADAGERVKENDAAAAEVAVKDTDSTSPVAADVTASAVSLDDVKAEVHDDKAPHDASAQVRHSPVMVSSGDSNHMIELQADEKSDVNKPVNANDLTPEQRALKSDAEAAVTAGDNKENSAGDMLAPAATAASDKNSSEPEVTPKQAKKEPQKTAAQAPSPKKERSRSGARGTPSSTPSAAPSTKPAATAAPSTKPAAAAAPSTKPAAAAAPSAKPAADDSRRREAEEAKAKLAERRKEARERAQREAEEAARREAEEK